MSLPSDSEVSISTLARLFSATGHRSLTLTHSKARPAIANLILTNLRTDLVAAQVALKHDQVIQVVEMLMSAARLSGMGIDPTLSLRVTTETTVRIENSGSDLTLVAVGAYETKSSEWKQGGSALMRLNPAEQKQLLAGLQDAASLTYTDALRRRDKEQYA